MIRNIIGFLTLLVCVGTDAFAKEFPVSEIPDSLLRGAHVVKRFEEVRFEIMSTTETILKKKYALTVLNKNGDDYAVFEERFDALRSVRAIDGKLLDAAGSEIKSVKNKDIRERSAISSGSIYEDAKVKEHNFDYHQYPYTVVYEVTVRYNHSFYFEPWMPQDSEDLAVQESHYTLVHPTVYGVRIKAFNYTGKGEETIDGNNKITRWSLNNKKAISRPYASPAWHELTTAVYIAPTNFTIGSYQGNMATWKAMGLFHNTLNSGRDVLPDAVKADVARICAPLIEAEEKVKKLYEYLQQNTRYISIQLGVGGWQPFDAAYVAKNRYGDCKALSNYMYSLLKEAGITARYAIIKAGYSRDAKRILEDFPMPQFNHVVLCVPVAKDTMWLECTSQSESAGYMGGFTGNRKALLVTPEGGVLAATPRYSVAENSQIRRLDGKLDAAGNLLVSVHTKYTGEQQDGITSLVENTNANEVKEKLNEKLDLPTYEVLDYKYTQKKDRLPEVSESLNLELQRWATVSGKRLFLQPNMLSQSTFKLESDTARTCDYVFDMEYRDVDSLELELPDGYTPEAMPKDVSLKTKYGHYRFTTKLDNNRLFVLRSMEQYAGRYPAKEGVELEQFWDAVFKSDRARVVLVKKE
jgi:uncharacterized protein YegP (UPF0339 family)